MTLSDLASLGSFVSGVAVLVSLVYLALQVRQAEKNQQASIRQARNTRAVDIALARAEPSMADALGCALSRPDDMSERQVGQFIALCHAYFLNFEDSYFQYRAGLLPPSGFETARQGMEYLIANPGVRFGWRTFRSSFVKEFADFMDALIQATPVSPPTELLAAWKAGIAAEKTAARHEASPERENQE